MEAHIDPKISRWETVLSDLRGLYFVSLFEDKESLRYTVEDEAGQKYEIIIVRPGPYRMADEQHLIHYWNASPPRRGWTFMVDNPGWVADLMLRDVFTPRVHLYAVATFDTCLEVLAEEEPRVRAL